HPSLLTHRRLLPLIIRPVKELTPRGIHRRQQRKPLFDRFPFRHWINAHAFACQTGKIQGRTVLFFDVTTKECRHFEPALRIDSRRVVAAQHCVPFERRRERPPSIFLSAHLLETLWPLSSTSLHRRIVRSSFRPVKTFVGFF